MNCWLDKRTKRRHFGLWENGATLFLTFSNLKIIVVAALVCTHFSRSPSSLYICFPCYFLQDHPGPPLSPPSHCLSFSLPPFTHPSFISISPKVIWVGPISCLPLLPQSLVKSRRCHSYLEIPPFFPPGSIHHSNYYFLLPFHLFSIHPQLPSSVLFPPILLIIPVQFFIFPVIFPPVRLPCLLSPLLNSIYSLMRSYMSATAFNPCILKLKTKETRPRLQSLPIPSLLSLTTLCCQCFSRCSAVASTTHINLSSVYGCKCTGSKL